MSKFHTTTLNCITEFKSKDIVQYPRVCPHCFEPNNPDILSVSNHSLDDKMILSMIHKCNHCDLHFLSITEEDKEEMLHKNIFVHPSTFRYFRNEVIEKVSPKFIDMYNQAYKAEYNSTFELASIGYRTALEYLIKDFAINVLNKPSNEVSKKSLFEAISSYLPNEQLCNSADVIRILGNDATHYEKKYPEHDFEILKKYVNIFVQLIEFHLLANNPPVSRL